MSKLQNQYLALAASFMAIAENKSLYDEECFTAPKFYCCDCSHCPQGNKTYCKAAKRTTSKSTSVNKCKHFLLIKANGE